MKFIHLAARARIGALLGTLLGIEDDETEGPNDGDDLDDHLAAQWALYEFSGWLLEWTVMALSGEAD